MIRAYFVISANFAPVPTEEEWQAIIADAIENSTLHDAIQNPGNEYTVLAHNHIQSRKRSRNAAHRLKYTMLSFELGSSYSADVITLMEAEAATRGITGDDEGDRFRQVMQAEVQEAATRLDFTPTQANNLLFQVVAGYGGRMEAINQTQVYVDENKGIWHEAE